MSAKDHYSQYVTDKTLLSTYNQYQEKYKKVPRESDKVLISKIAQLAVVEKPSLLDIGCSTGNLLFHLKNALPHLRLEGADLAESSIEACRRNPDLEGVDFSILDICDLPTSKSYDIIVANAVAVYFDWDTYKQAMQSVFNALVPGGSYLAFEWIHKFAVQDLTIVETSEWNPAGLKFHFRSMKKVEAVLKSVGFQSVEFSPFELPIDLPMLGYDADVVTYTRKDEHGERMAFRGTLYQPWCHMIARKPE